MEVKSDWYNRLIKELDPYLNTLSKKDKKKYKIDLLMRIAIRIDNFYPACGECQMLQQEITKLFNDIRDALQMSSQIQMPKETRKNYFKAINNITKHLQKHHKLITEGQYLGTGLVIGIGAGTAIGASLGNTGIGPALGTVLGLVIGKYLDKKAKDEGRLI
ncbi:hypothetical protein ACFLTT_00640 [Chloroflexota bacterium]